jgi:hypothetical protein
MREEIDPLMFDPVNDALGSMPLEPPPANLFPAVMRQVRRQQAAMPRFRLSWLDLALSLFAAGMAGLVVILAWLFLPDPGPELLYLEQWLDYFALSNEFYVAILVVFATAAAGVVAVGFLPTHRRLVSRQP